MRRFLLHRTDFLPGEPTGWALGCPLQESAPHLPSPPFLPVTHPPFLLKVSGHPRKLSWETFAWGWGLDLGAGPGRQASEAPSSAPHPALPVQPPAADSVPVQNVSLLQQGPRLPRLPRPALPGGGGEPCAQGRDQVLLLQEGAHPVGPGRRQLGEPWGAHPLPHCPGLSWNTPELGPALQPWKELWLSGPRLRIMNP